MKPEPGSTTLFNNHQSINCRGRLLDFSEPRIMGILNITPDSFFDGGKFTEEKAILKQAGQMRSQGADIIDIGAQSTRPGAKLVSESTELKRLLPAISALLTEHPEAIISVDTFSARVAKKCIEEGAAIVNDVSAGALDKMMFKTIASLNVPYILMHMQGTPATMQKDPSYQDVVSEVMGFLLKKTSLLQTMGVKDLLIDPGFGFGKTVEHNYALLDSLEAFRLTGYPVVAGISRKSMICKVLKVNPDKALNGTTALNMAALMKGAAILRVHDVKEARETIQLFKQLKRIN